MKRIAAVTALFLMASVLKAANVDEVLKSARRMCANDSVPQALLLLEEEIKTEKKVRDEFLLQQEKGDILLYYARLPHTAAKVYEGLTKIDIPKGKAAGQYYRLGYALEHSEDFMRAARSYEKVITDFPDSEFSDDALAAIERCFVKNYQTRAAEVNGYPVTELEVDEVASKLSPKEQQYAATPQGRKELIERVVYERLLKVAASREFASPDSTEVLLKLNCFSCRPKKVLLPGHLTDAQLARRIAEEEKNMMLKTLYLQEVVQKVEVTEKDKKRYYKEHPERFTSPEKYTLREIVTDSVMLDSVLAAFDAGTPFDSVARLYSTVHTSSQGGLIGTYPITTFPLETRPVAETLKVGATSGPFATRRGWEIIMVEDRTEEVLASYEQSERLLDELVRRQETEELSAASLERFNLNAGVDTVPSGDTLAWVAGVPILEAELDSFITARNIGMMVETDSTYKSKVLSQLISDRVFDHELAQQKLFLSDSLSNLLESGRRQKLVDAYMNKIFEEASVQPTDEEIEEYYKTNKKEFYYPAKAKVWEMLVTDRDTANMIYKLVTREGADFDSLAKIYSVAETANRGGYAGFINQGESDKPYEKQAFKTKEGSISKPVSSEEGYWLVKVDSRQKANQKTLEQVNAPIRSKIYRQKREAAEAALKERLFAQADVIYFTPDEPEIPEEGSTGFESVPGEN